LITPSVIDLALGVSVRRLAVVIASIAAALLSLGVPVASADSLPMTLVQDGFSNPVFLTNAGDSRLFVVERGGVIEIIHDDNSVSTFLDIHTLVNQNGGEQGLLGLAFHPDYASNGLFYVYYTMPSGSETLVEFKRSTGNADAADPNSKRVLLTLSDPYSNHNGGWMAFKGDNLYLSLGDGGSAGDPQNRAQNLDRWWGKILRINPLDPDGNGPLTYSIPAGNPFVGKPGKDEIWSYGLRNPWRCSFDDMTGKLWCGDVGQDSYEGSTESSPARTSTSAGASSRASTITTGRATRVETCAPVAASNCPSPNTRTRLLAAAIAPSQEAMSRVGLGPP
jgi:glucose/arabinose dehydrogenase